MEVWINEHAQRIRGLTKQYEKLTKLKKEYVESIEIEKY